MQKTQASLLVLLGLICMSTTVQGGLFHRHAKQAAPAQTAVSIEIPAFLNNTVEFVDGLAFGIIHKDILVDLQRCYHAEGTIGHDIEHAINDFKIGGVLGYISGALRIIKIIKEIPNSFSGCEDAGTDLKTLVAWAELQLKDTTALEEKMAKNYVWNIESINKDLGDAKTRIEGNDYYTGGVDIGNAVSLLTQ